MKMLTFHQPWAQLIAHGAKTIETRAWSTRYRGPLAIHAAKSIPAGLHLTKVGDWTIMSRFTEPESGPELRRLGAVDGGTLVPDRVERGHAVPLPLGAVVAVCDLVDVVPITAMVRSGQACVVVQTDPGAALWRREPDGMGEVWRHRGHVDDQLPFGDFRPDRFAWLLGNVRALAAPVPARGHQGLRDIDGGVLTRVLAQLEEARHG